MSKYGRIEILVGAFVVAGFLSLCMLAFRVSGLAGFYDSSEGYFISARFTEVGGLKIRSRVAVAGVPVGRVVAINLDKETFEAIVTMRIERAVNNLPTDTTATIATSGLIGDKYIMLEPGADEEVIFEGGEIELTDPAVVLERLIGQFLYKSGQ